MLQKILEDKKNILFCGIGGGFDIFVSLPFFYPYTLSSNICPYSFEVPKKHFVFTNVSHNYHPEELFKNNTYEVVDFTSISIPSAGVKPNIQIYKDIISKYNIDCIVMFDGGFDSILTGREIHRGTIVEDFVSMAAIKECIKDNLVLKENTYLICCGYGAEIEEKIYIKDIDKCISDLMPSIIDSGVLNQHSTEFKFYKTSYEAASELVKRKSHIHSRIIAAAEGKRGIFEEDNMFGKNEKLNVNYTDKMAEFILFKGWDVLERNKTLNELKNTMSFFECYNILILDII